MEDEKQLDAGEAAGKVSGVIPGVIPWAVPVLGARAVPLDDQRRIAIDLECIRCGYNLRMCDGQGRCPECGLAVGRSSVGRFLRYHEPKWVQCLAWGMNRFAVALLLLVMTVLMVVGLEMWGGEDRGDTTWLTLSLVASVCLACAAAGFGVLGLARATWPNPTSVEPESWWSARRLTRMVFVMAAGWQVAVFVMILSGLRYVRVVDNVVGNASAFLFFGTWVLLPGLLLLHARELAKRIPRVGLARVTLVLAGMIGVTGFATTVLMDNWLGWLDVAAVWYEKLWPGSWMGFFNTWRPGDPWYGHNGFSNLLRKMWSVAWIAFVVSLLAIVPLFFVYWKALHREAAKAKATWAASPWLGKESGADAAAEGDADDGSRGG